MKYIGPFLRINSLNIDIISNQMFHLAKESIKNISLESNCGISIPYKDVSRELYSTDGISKNDFHPLCCLYKKASPKLLIKDNKLLWEQIKVKPHIDIESNAYLILSLLELCDYYKAFEGINKYKYNMFSLYKVMCMKQLEFCASYLRDPQGLFISKDNVSETLNENLSFESTDGIAKFHNQALIMCAYYKYSLIAEPKIGEDYEHFATDILNMFIDYKDELYNLSLKALAKTVFALNLYYHYSKNIECLQLILDLTEVLMDNYHELKVVETPADLELSSLLAINLLLASKNSDISLFNDSATKIVEDLIELYDDNLALFVPNPEEKSIKFSSTDVTYPCFALMLYSSIIQDDSHDYLLVNNYRSQLLNSGIIMSWPDSPSLDDPERYKNFSQHSKDLLNEQDFKPMSVPSPTSTEVASVFTKRVEYNKKKQTFKASSPSFDSSKNLPIFFMMIFCKPFFNNNIDD